MLLFFAQYIFAQTGKIYGSIIDKSNNDPLIGATVLIIETGSGTVSDIDGSFELSLAPGTYTLEASYTGYQVEKVTEMDVKAGETIKLDFQLSSGTQELDIVVVTATAKRNSAVNLLLLQQKSISIATGISSDQIKLSPDRNTSDVLKRVSGASVQDNKYVVIRGLSDRYNSALLNGLSLPSSEPDKRAFSFDIFPSNLLDNLVIYKSATADLPGEFAGGVIQLNTKEIPQEPFANLSLSMGYNTQSTFKNFQTYQGSETDWLGYDDGTRGLPGELKNVSRDTFNSNLSNQKRYSALFPNDWAVLDESSMRPSLGLQVSAGRSFGNFGIVGALTYSNSPKIQTGTVSDFTNDGQRYEYFDTRTKINTNLGGLLNLAYKISPKSKIQFNNTYTITSDDQFSFRTGEDIEQERLVEAYSYFYTSNKLHTSQLIGDHAFGPRNIKLTWGASYNRITRDVPSYRRMWYFKNNDDPAESPFVATVQPGNPSPNFAGNFYSDQEEKFYVGKADLTVPYNLGARKGNLKLGGLYEDKTREFNANVYGFVSFFQTPQELKTLPVGEIFAPENVNEQGFLIKESTDRSDSYDGATNLKAGYAMIEQSIDERLRVIGGVRVEQYQQQLNSFRVRTTTPINVDTSFTDVLPSLHFIYAVSEKTNIRLTGTRTVSRPNLREIAPFSFYDFFIERDISGNPDLIRTKIWNADLRYETYPGEAKYFAASLFYKKFDNPIEQVQIPGTNTLTWANVPGAVDFGIELEGRWKLSNISAALTDFTVFGNVSYIYSDVDITDLGEGQLERPLYGQSPYLVNVGLNYANPNAGISSTILFNRIGRRIWLVGFDQDPHIWEAPRSVLDFQVTKDLGKYLELKLTIGDILNQRANFYQDFNDNGKYDNVDDDGLILSNRYGTNFSIGLSYSFSRD
jgi:TonB-dependent receptor